MPESATSAQRYASAADSGKVERLRLTLAAGGIVLVLAVIVVLLRFHRLSELPPGLAYDEALNGELALKVLQGEHAVFFPVSDGREAAVIYALALVTSVLGRTLLAAHLPTALGSAGLVFAVFWLGQVLFGRTESGRATPWRGLLVSGVAAGLLAVFLSQTVIGRTAYNKVTHMPLLLSLCLALLWLGWSKPGRSLSTEQCAEAEKQRSWWWIALVGLCAGLLPYTYIPARFTPFLFFLFGMSFLLPLRAPARKRIRAELPWVGLFVGVAGLVAAPILIHFALHPAHFFMRSSQLSIFDSNSSQAGLLGAFLVNLWEHLLVFGFRGDPNWRHNFPGQPMLTLGESFFFWLGVGTTVFRWQRPAHRLLFLWLGVLFLPAVLSRDDTVPHFLRLTGAVPAIYLLVGVGVWEAFRFLKERFFRENEIGVAFAVGAVASGLILVQGVTTYRTYFQKWAVAPEVREAHSAAWTDLILTLNEQPPDADMAYLVPRHKGLYDFRYLYQGAAPVHVFHTTAPGLAQKIESTLTAMENLSTVKVVEWDANAVWIDGRTRLISVLLDKYGRFQDSEEYADFQIRTYTDVALERPWTLYEQLEPLTVEYDGGIALQGFALGQGEGQLSSEQLPSLGENRSLWMALKWQLAPGLGIDYAISVRLHDAEGGGVYQKDVALWETDYTWAGGGEPSEQFVTLVQLDLPADLQPGEYELRLVVYDVKSLKPTVELGVWEPEATLTRLRLAEFQ